MGAHLAAGAEEIKAPGGWNASPESLTCLSSLQQLKHYSGFSDIGLAHRGASLRREALRIASWITRAGSETKAA